MRLEASRQCLLRVAISGGSLRSRSGATARGGAALEPMGRSKATVQFPSAVDEIKP